MCGLQHGVATVGTRGYNTDKILDRARGNAFYLAATNNEEEYTEYVLKLLCQPALRAEIASSGQNLYQNHFTWEHIAHRLQSVLQLHTKEHSK